MSWTLPPGLHGTERVVEYSWVANKLQSRSSVLDIGTVAPPIMSGYPEFVFTVTRRLGCRYVTLDVMPGADILADIRDVQIAEKSFDAVVCISTLEHITIRPADALRNMLAIGKEVFLTMPYGFYHQMPWGFQYDEAHLRELLLDVLADNDKPTQGLLEESYYFHDRAEGWLKSSAEFLSDYPYWSSGSEGAAGVVCLHFGPAPTEVPQSDA